MKFANFTRVWQNSEYFCTCKAKNKFIPTHDKHNYTDTVLNNQGYCLYKEINSLGYFPGESAINFELIMKNRIHRNTLWSNSYGILKLSQYIWYFRLY